MLTLSPSVKVFLAAGSTDMRKGAVSLAGAVRTILEQEPTSGHLFVFCSRRRNLLKILYWDGSGFWLLTKRLARGTFAWPEAREGSRALDLRPEELGALLGGVDLAKTTWRPWWRQGAASLPPPPVLPAAC